MRDKFLFFKNFKTVAEKLPDDMRLKFYDAMTAYVFDGVESDDPVIAALVGAIKPSLDKVDNRGGNHNPTGQNQYNEVKRGQNEVKVGQSGQSFQETRNKKQEVLKKKNDKKKKGSNAVQSDSYEGGTPL